MSTLVIVPTGTANTASVAAAVARLGVTAHLSVDGKTIAEAEHLVVPGVGSFGAAAAALDRLGVRETLIERLQQGRPTLAICVGMQILAGTSTESPGARGLGVIEGEFSRFPNGAGVPQLGWNTLRPGPGSRFIEPGWAYFANSYRITSVPQGWVGTECDHGGTFVAALEKGDVLACQFHPELSGSFGEQVLRRWVQKTGAVS